jgi:hypothetical protein
MKVNFFIIMGILSFLFAQKSNGQNNLIDITSKSEEGFQDLVLNIIDKKIDNNVWILIAKGQFKGTVVGIKIKMANGLKPGIINSEIDNGGFARSACEISSIGQESDNFIKILSELYGQKTNKKFTSKPLIFNSFSLNTNQALLDKGYFKFKLFFDDLNEQGLYSEIFLNLNLPEGFIEIPEKDPEYRENLIKAMTK